MKRLIWMAAFCMVLPLGARAQASNENLVTNTTKQIVARYSKLLVATAKEMPANKYSYHPTKKQMTFGQVIAHIAESNVFLCSKLSDAQMPKMKASASQPKAMLVQEVQHSFDYCMQSLDKLQDSQLGETVTLFRGRPGKRIGALFGLTGDLHDHYAALSVYVRLNGLLPPTAQHRM